MTDAENEAATPRENQLTWLRARNARTKAALPDIAVGIAGARAPEPGVYVDYQRLRAVEFAFVNADHGVAREAFDEDEVESGLRRRVLRHGLSVALCRG